MVLFLGLACLSPAFAQEPPSLVQMVQTLTANGTFPFNALGLTAAQTDDAAFASLQKICAPLPNGGPPPNCTGATFQLFDQLRELEQTADELLGRGPTQYSLHLGPAGMAAALQWTAPEEYAAQGSIATKFANSQAALLSNRFAALRFASTGLAGGFADNAAPYGGSAGADPPSADFGRWSMYANDGFGAGEKQPTIFEDAFAFDNTQGSVGLDVRVTRHLVLGVLAGHTEERVDFNSDLSIVDGRVRGNGQSLLAYLQWEGDAGYLNFALGGQHLTIKTTRKITYPSNNPSIPPVNETAYSDTGSNNWMATLGAGLTLHVQAAAFEPYVNVQSVNVRIAPFTEYNSNAFDVSLAAQSVRSLQGAAGLKFELVFLGRFGVLVPYVYGEARHEFRDASRVVNSSYAALGQTEFAVPTDNPTKTYYVAGGGGSLVLKHGVQGFLQYYRVLEYANYTDHVVSGGIRWEF